MANGQQDEAAIAKQFAGKSEAEIAAQFAGGSKPPLADTFMSRLFSSVGRPPGGGEEAMLAEGAEPGLGLLAIPSAVKNPVGAGLGLAGGLGGGLLGREGGKALGFGEFGQNALETAGQWAGGLAGGFFGGMRPPSGSAPVEPEIAPKLFPKKQALDIPGATTTAPGAQRWEGPTPPPRQPTPFPTVQPKPSLAVSPEQPRPQWFPEPRPETPIDRPGSMWSVERETLPGRATRGQPGALDVLTNVSARPPLVTPRPSVGNADPEFTGMRNRLFGELGYKSSQVTSQSDVVPQGAPTPFPRVKRLPEEVQ